MRRGRSSRLDDTLPTTGARSAPTPGLTVGSAPPIDATPRDSITPRDPAPLADAGLVQPFARRYALTPVAPAQEDTKVTMGDSHLHGELDANSLSAEGIVAARRAGSYGFYSSESALGLQRPGFRRFVDVTLRLDGTSVLAHIECPARPTRTGPAQGPGQQSCAWPVRSPACRQTARSRSSSVLSTRRTSYSFRANQHATRGTEAMPVRVTPRATEDLEP